MRTATDEVSEVEEQGRRQVEVRLNELARQLRLIDQQLRGLDGNSALLGELSQEAD